MLTIILALLPALVLFTYILWTDRRQPEPANELIKALGLGVLSTFLSFIISGPFLLLGLYSPADTSYLGALRISLFGAGIPEELVKFFVLWLAVKRNKFFDERMDGLVYAACVGLGFAGAENILYLSTNGGILAEIATTRALLSVPLHFCCALFMGYWFSKWWWGKDDSGNPSRDFNNLLITLCIPILLHTAYDWVCFSSHNFIDNQKPTQMLAFYVVLFLACCVFHSIARAKTKQTQQADQQEAVAEPTQIKMGEYDPDTVYQVYTNKQINFCSFFFSPLAGMLMTSHNCDVHNDLKGKNRVWLYTILIFAIAVVVAAHLSIGRISYLSIFACTALFKHVMDKHVDLIPATNLQDKTVSQCIKPALCGLGFALIMAIFLLLPVLTEENNNDKSNSKKYMREYFEQLVADEPVIIDVQDAEDGKVEAMCALAVQYWLMDNDKKNAEADKWIKKAVEEKNSDFVVYWINEIAYMYHGKERYEDAIVILEHSIKLFPKEANLYDSCGEMYLLIGDKNEAIHKWNQVIDIDSDFLDHVPNHETDLHKFLKEAGSI